MTLHIRDVSYRQVQAGTGKYRQRNRPTYRVRIWQTPSILSCHLNFTLFTTADITSTPVSLSLCRLCRRLCRLKLFLWSCSWFVEKPSTVDQDTHESCRTADANINSPTFWTSPYFCSDRRAGTQTWNRPLFVTSYAYLLLASRPAPGVYGG